MYFVELDAYDPASGQLVTQRLCSGGRGHTTRPGDTPANAVFLPRAQEPYQAGVSTHSDYVSGGVARTDAPNVEVADPGGLFAGVGGLFVSWFDLAWDGRPFRVLEGERGAAYADLVQRHTGVLKGRPAYDGAAWRFEVQGRFHLLEMPLQESLYSGSGGLEGGEDLAGKPKPLCFGQIYNAPAVLVDPVQLLFQVHDGPVQAIGPVRDMGLPLGLAQDYPDAAALLAASYPGQYATCLAEGLFRLGSPPVGRVTCDVQGDSQDGYAATPGALVHRILIRSNSFGDQDFLAGAVDALDAVCPWTCGVYHTGATTLRQCLEPLLQSAAACLVHDAQGRLFFGRLPSPLTTAVAHIPQRRIKKIGRERGLESPFWRVVVRYRQNVQPEKSSFAGAVSEADRAALRVDYLDAVAEDAAVKTAHLQAGEMELETRLADAAQAQALADDLLAYHKAPRSPVRVTVTRSEYPDLELMDVVSVSHPRFGLDAATGRVVAMDVSLADDEMELTIYA